MSAAATPLEQALELHRAGRLGEAETLYRQVLAVEADNPDALHLLGVVDHRLGRFEAAVAHIGRAIGLRPEVAYYHNDLGLALSALARGEGAEAAYREALRLDREFFEAWQNLAALLIAGERWAAAEAACRAALRLRPQAPRAHTNLGLALVGRGRRAEAEAAYHEAMRFAPEDADAHNHLGALHYEAGLAAEAVASFARAALLQPGASGVHSNLGAALHQHNRPAAAIAAYQKALAIDPDNAGAHVNLAFSLLALGRFAEGWREYEWRWRVNGGPKQHPIPLWRGEPLAGRTILLYAEQGFGDAIQFARYAPLVAARGGRVILEMPTGLVRLAASLGGVERVVAAGEPLPGCDLCCPLMSLPGMLGTEVATIPAAVPYLAADAAAVAAWRRRLAALSGRRVGLVWAGSRRPDPLSAAADRRRSMRLFDMAPLATLPDISFVSLQKGEPAAQAAAPPAGMVLRDWSDELRDFADTAALVTALDLVVTVDTAVVHLAGALGQPVWLLSRHDACWRWLLDRDDSPWYPSLRHFRQQRPGDWNTVIAAVRDALSHFRGGGTT